MECLYYACYARNMVGLVRIVVGLYNQLIDHICRSFLAFMICILAYLFRTGSMEDPESRDQLKMPLAWGVRGVITGYAAIAVCGIGFTIWTLSRYSVGRRDYAKNDTTQTNPSHEEKQKLARNKSMRSQTTRASSRIETWRRDSAEAEAPEPRARSAPPLEPPGIGQVLEVPRGLHEDISHLRTPRAISRPQGVRPSVSDMV
jgi:hypothetical protein